MTDNMKIFLEKISEEEEIKAKLKSINEEAPDDASKVDAIISLAKDLGLQLTAEDFDDKEAVANKMSEDELDSVNGGTIDFYTDGKVVCACNCIVYGSGFADSYMNECVCYAGGWGTFTEKGKQLAAKGVIPSCGAKGAKVPFYCPAIGIGVSK